MFRTFLKRFSGFGGSLIKTLILASLLLKFQQLSAQQPEVILFPWKTSFIRPEVKSRLKAPLTASHKLWRQQVADPLLSLSQYIEKNSLGNAALNLKHHIDKIYVAQTAASEAMRNKMMQPILCQLSAHYLVSVVQSDRLGERLMNSGHHLIEEKQWQRALTEEKIEQLLIKSLELAWQRSQQNTASQKDDSTMRIGLGLGLQQNAQEQVPGYCLNLIVAEALLSKGYQLPSFIGLEQLAMINRAIPMPRRQSRASRYMALTWTDKKTQSKEGLFPLVADLRYSLAESVFANRIARSSKHRWVFNKSAQGVITPVFDQALLDALAQEQAALQRDKLPKISYINKAWVYLDKGRAWGLKMNDRLRGSDSDNEVFGHVVGFYGPEMKIKSPLGYPVSEGAIVFVRKGQKNVKIGQSFNYDLQTYPTPWPPK